VFVRAVGPTAEPAHDIPVRPAQPPSDHAAGMIQAGVIPATLLRRRG
jgi:hypothetical protein